MTGLTMLRTSITNSLSGGRSFYINDGTSDNQYVLPTAIAVGSGDTLTFKFLAPASAYESGNQYFFFDAHATSANAFISNTAGRMFTTRATVKLDAVTFVDGSNLPKDGLEHTLEFTFTATTNVKVFAGNINGSACLNNFPMYDIELDASATNFWAVDDGSQTLNETNTGSPDLTIDTGYNASFWS